MELLEFAQKLHKSVEDFLGYYKRESEAHPNLFPSDMDEAEWWDQFNAYLSVQESGR